MSEKILCIAFAGAGAINFGGAEGPWDHATRLEKIGGIQVVGIVDPLVEKATDVLTTRKAGKFGKIYEKCQVFATLQELLEKKPPLDAIFIGIPPNFRGSCDAGKDVELQCIKAGINCFIEKPLSVTPPEDFAKYVDVISKAQEEKSVIVSVGYMFRYHAAVNKMKELIQQHGGKVMAVNARYYLAYSELAHAFWWDVSKSGGPIVEQATHFCDLARYLVGEVDLDSVQATCIPASDDGGVGELKHIAPGMEDGVRSENRAPRVTSAQWKFTGGGIGTLMHVIALQGKRYESQIDVLMDGLRMTLYEPYHPDCKLLVRDGKTGSDYEVALDYGSDDPYEKELKAFVDAVNGSNASKIKSSYMDAAQSYLFSWAIRRKCES